MLSGSGLCVSRLKEGIEKIVNLGLYQDAVRKQTAPKEKLSPFERVGGGGGGLEFTYSGLGRYQRYLVAHSP